MNMHTEKACWVRGGYQTDCSPVPTSPHHQSCHQKQLCCCIRKSAPPCQARRFQGPWNRSPPRLVEGPEGTRKRSKEGLQSQLMQCAESINVSLQLWCDAIRSHRSSAATALLATLLRPPFSMYASLTRLRKVLRLQVKSLRLGFADRPFADRAPAANAQLLLAHTPHRPRHEFYSSPSE